MIAMVMTIAASFLVVHTNPEGKCDQGFDRIPNTCIGSFKGALKGLAR